MIRLLHPDAKPGRIAVAGPGHHYLRHVHRVEAGDALEVFDGRGGAYPAHVRAIAKDDLELELGPRVEAPKVRPVTLLQGIPKADKLELVIQKACELWASELVPVYCSRSVVKPSDRDAKKQSRWQRISDEASRQCGRADVMRVRAPVLLADAVTRSPAMLVLDENERAASLSQAVRALPEGAALALVIGPEGGFTDEERALLEGHEARPVSLGRLVLRTETAALAALAVVRHLDGLIG